MNTQGKVNKMMFSKTELSTEKVELANIKDFKAKIKTVDKSRQNFTSDIVSIVNARESARKKYVNLVNDFSDLGVDMPQKI